ncbi:hypothetical protein MMC09_002735 [Bachmanniomyces sp. S44760]|nr:hypothetical protein [Bachmanniomyces sp. S44760]
MDKTNHSLETEASPKQIGRRIRRPRRSAHQKDNLAAIRPTHEKAKEALVIEDGDVRQLSEEFGGVNIAQQISQPASTQYQLHATAPTTPNGSSGLGTSNHSAVGMTPYSSWRADRTIPGMKSTQGSLHGYSLRSGQLPMHGNVTYKPVRSVPIFRVMPPWRINRVSSLQSAVGFTVAHKKNVKIPSTVDENILDAGGQKVNLPTRPAASSNWRQPGPPDLLPARPPKQLSAIPTTDKVKVSARGTKVPEPTLEYLAQASCKPVRTPKAQSLLIVLDLNGTLLQRSRSSSAYTARPSLDKFLQYCLQEHKVMIWSSATPRNVNIICSRLFSKTQRQQIIREWGRDTLGLTPSEYNDNVQVYKRLDVIWDDPLLQPSHPSYTTDTHSWNQHNTILIDDSATKARKHPYNHIEVPEFFKTGDEARSGSDILGQVVGYIEELRKWNDVSKYIKLDRFGVNKGWTWNWNRRGKEGSEAELALGLSASQPIVIDPDQA